jgi:hypothetical protein
MWNQLERIRQKTIPALTKNIRGYLLLCCDCNLIYQTFSRSQWPSGLRQVLSSAARTLGSQIRILLGAWMFVCVFLCCVALCR